MNGLSLLAREKIVKSQAVEIVKELPSLARARFRIAVFPNCFLATFAEPSGSILRNLSVSWLELMIDEQTIIRIVSQF